MKNKSHHTEKLNKLSAELMQRYAQGSLSSIEQHAVEQYLLDHPFEAEAIEGMSYADNFNSELAGLQTKLEQRTAKDQPKVIPLWKQPLKIAAALALLVVSSVLIINSFDLFNQDNNELALNETKEESKAKDKTESSKPIAIEDKESADIESSTIEQEESGVPDEVDVQEENKEVIPVLAMKVEDEPKEVIQLEKLRSEDDKMEKVYFAEQHEERESKQDEGDVSKKEMTLNPSITNNSGKSMARKSKMVSAPIITKERLIQGVITSMEDGRPLPGVNVISKETGNGTITDINGEYEIIIIENDDILSYSYLGFETQDVEIINQDSINVQLGANLVALSEVVITAQGIERETKSLGYSIKKGPTVDNKNASPINGYPSYRKYLEDSLIYPPQAISSNIKGRVVVEFYVRKNGMVSDFNVMKSLGYGCDKEALRLIKEGPVWEPAISNEEAVDKKVRVKVKFEL